MEKIFFTADLVYYRTLDIVKNISINNENENLYSEIFNLNLNNKTNNKNYLNLNINYKVLFYW